MSSLIPMQTTLSRYFSVVSSGASAAPPPAPTPTAAAVVEEKPVSRLETSQEETASPTATAPPAAKRARVDACEESESSKDADGDPLRAALERVEFDEALHARCVRLFRAEPVTGTQKKAKEERRDREGEGVSEYEAGMVRNLPASVRAQLTPMERTVVALKEAHPALVLLCEVGYKYKVYGEDARLARALLRVVAFVDYSFLSLMVPAVRVAFHVRRLVAAGHRVGLVRQTEVAAVKALSDTRSRPFARALTDIYTPATLVGPDFDDDIGCGCDSGCESNDGNNGNNKSSKKNGSGIDNDDDRALPRYILALCECHDDNSDETSENSRNNTEDKDIEEDVKIAFVAADLSNGEVVYDEAPDDALRTGLATVFAHLRPVELLVPPAQMLGAATAAVVRRYEASAGALVTVRPTWATEHAPAPARAALASFFADNNAAGSGESSVKDDDAMFETKTALHGQDQKQDQNQLPETIATLPEGVQCCLAALAGHLAPFGLCRSLLLTATFRPFAQGRTMLLPGPTVANLELFAPRDGRSGTRGTLFALVARTRTAFGRRLLRRWLAAPLCDPVRIRARQDAVEELLLAAGGCSDVSSSTMPLDGDGTGTSGTNSACTNSDKTECVAQLGAALEGLPDIERGLCHMQHARCTPREFVAVLRALRHVSAALPSPARTEQCLRAPLLRATLAAIPNVRARADAHLARLNEDVAADATSPTAAVVMDTQQSSTTASSSKKRSSTSNKMSDNSEEDDDSSAYDSNRKGIFKDTTEFPELAERESEVARCEGVLRECLAAARAEAGRPSLVYRHLAKEPYVLELPSGARAPAAWVKVNGTARVTRWRTPAGAAALAELERARALRDAATAAAWCAFLRTVAAADDAAFRASAPPSSIPPRPVPRPPRSSRSSMVETPSLKH